MPTTLTPSMLQTEHHQMCVLPSVPQSVGTARRWSMGLMAEWGVADELRSAAGLSVSELVANATVHGACEVVACRLSLREGRLSVEVREWLPTGGSAGSPNLGEPSTDAEGGRGLLLVEALSSGWGWRRPDPGSEKGSCVWAQFGEAR